ncbi:hypothetical protein SVAN01_02819 [Stagonosporopsis vannaccii]|nr:hypothetical protein SVAN01_02819 [Stagonosporopsis vannaccii]
MARFTAAAPPVPKGERATMNAKVDQPSSHVEHRGEDPFALTQDCDFFPPSQQTRGAAPAGMEGKPTEDTDDEVAMPIPIATLVFQDGRTEPVYTPLLGHEHLFSAQSTSSSAASFSKRVHRPIQAAPVQVSGKFTCLRAVRHRRLHASAGTPQLAIPEPPKQSLPQKQPTRRPRRSVAQKQGLLKSKSLKRTRSVAQGLAPNSNADAAIGGNDHEQTIEVVTEESKTFYIGDIDAFKEFLRCRFDELTMKPLRGIATHWVKLLEPRRLGDWGKYHEMLPSEADTPPWWPKTVIYKEPSHLKKDDLSTLAVEMMLVHREIDEIKRKGPWISKLREVAKFTVQTTSADHFSSSKGAVHSEEMKTRAQEQILPSIFEVAQAYEDHITQYSLFEGSGNVDPGRGKHHTWKPIPRPIRRTQPKRPRRSGKDSLDQVPETTYDASGDETEPDDTMTRLARVAQASPQFLPIPTPTVAPTPRQSFSIEDTYRQTWSVDTPVSASGPCTPALPQDDVKMHRTASTPNSSFDHSLHGLHIGDESIDMKPQTRTMSEQGTMQPYNMVSYSQPMQYPTTPAVFSGQAYQSTEHYSNPAPSPFTQPAPTFVNPFSMYAAPSPLGYGQYVPPMPTTNGFAYDQNMFPPAPVSYASTPMDMQMPPSDPNMTFNGLPSEYSVSPSGLPHY